MHNCCFLRCFFLDVFFAPPLFHRVSQLTKNIKRNILNDYLRQSCVCYRKIEKHFSAAVAMSETAIVQLLTAIDPFGSRGFQP
jgi:hypothetical protein